MERRRKKEREQDLEDASLNFDHNSSPPPRHDRWKRARQKQGGEYTF